MGRLFSSSTFLAGVFTLLVLILGARAGIDVPALAAAAVPIAVGIKEAMRRRADADLDGYKLHAALERDRMQFQGDRDERFREEMLEAQRNRPPSPLDKFVEAIAEQVPKRHGEPGARFDFG